MESILLLALLALFVLADWSNFRAERRLRKLKDKLNLKNPPYDFFHTVSVIRPSQQRN